MVKSFIKLTLDITDEQVINTFKKLWLNSLYGKTFSQQLRLIKTQNGYTYILTQRLNSFRLWQLEKVLLRRLNKMKIIVL